jgi:hypothetical protein
MVPPRKPRGEAAKVTIANQDKQIRLLIDRCEDLRLTRDKQESYISQILGELEKSHRREEEAEKAHLRVLGWQDLARELLQPKSTGE